MTKNRTPTPVYLHLGMHPGLEVKGLKDPSCLHEGFSILWEISCWEQGPMSPRNDNSFCSLLVYRVVRFISSQDNTRQVRLHHYIIKFSLIFSQQNSWRWANAGLMLDQCRRRWANINPKLAQNLVLSGSGRRKKCRYFTIIKTTPARTRHWPNVVSMLGHRLRRWPSIETTKGQCLVLAAKLDFIIV